MAQWLERRVLELDCRSLCMSSRPVITSHIVHVPMTDWPSLAQPHKCGLMNIHFGWWLKASIWWLRTWIGGFQSENGGNGPGFGGNGPGLGGYGPGLRVWTR
jgi:hypothetical protein